MPRVDQKVDVLGGRGHVCRYVQGSSAGKYFYREWDRVKKRLSAKVIKGATNLDEAVELAVDVAFAMKEVPERQSSQLDPIELLRREERLISRQERLRRNEIVGGITPVTISEAVNEWLAKENRRVDAGLLERTSYLHKYYCLMHVAKYLEWKGVKKTNQINETTFHEYPVFRSNTTRMLQCRELSVLSEWLKSHLIRNKNIAVELWTRGNLLPKVEVRMTDRMKNPAINQDDWKVILDYVRDVWRKSKLNKNGNHVISPRQTWYYRNLFWHYILFSKATGMSPEEVLNLKWKNVEIRDVGRISESKKRQEIEEYESEGIEVIDDNEAEGGRWAASPESIGREERLIAYITTIRSKTKQPREIPCNQGKELRRWMKFIKEYLDKYCYDYKITGDSYVFMNPDNQFKAVAQAGLRQTWRRLVDGLKEEGRLQGHKFSPHPYTVYSLRSTFIEDHLLKGTDIFLLARIAGHDVKTLMQSYERMDIRKRAEEITRIEYGSKKKEDVKVELI